MTYPSAPPIDAPSTAKPGPKFVIALVLILAGIAIGVAGLVAAINSIVHDVHNSTTRVTPATSVSVLGTGTWEIYAVGGASTIFPSDVVVTGPSGAAIPTRGPGDTNQTLQINGHNYQGAVRFTIPVKATYRVQIQGPAGTPVLLSRPLLDVAKNAGKWFGVMGLGILIGILGVVLWIVGANRRRRARQLATMPAYAYPPSSYPGAPAPAQPEPLQSPPVQPAQSATGPLAAPGWYLDPEQPGSTRWWDGRQWTEHRNSP